MPSITPDMLVQAIETAMGKAWKTAKGTELPAEGKDDRKLLFSAISTGLLQVLHDQQSTLVTALSLSAAGAPAVPNTVTNLTLNISGL